MATPPLTLYQLLPHVLSLIEEPLPANYNNFPNVPNPPGAPDGPVFWSLKGEVYVQMVDSMFEAALMTGVVQLSSVQVTLPAEQTYFSLQNNTAIGIPKGVIAPLRLRAPWSVRKTSLSELDNYFPAWQQATPKERIQAWFPIGTSFFGIYPQFSVQSIVVMDFLVSPLSKARPYDGSEVVPFQQEFNDFLSQEAAATLRTKEGGAEADEAEQTFLAFMSRMKALSSFQARLDSLVYSKAFGGQSYVNPKKVM